MAEGESSERHTLTGRTTHGFVWMFGQSMAAKVVTTIGQIVLAWLLEPDAWGLIGLTFTLIVFTENIRTMGVRQVLVHRQGSYRRWANASFWMSATLAVVAAVVMVAAAAPVAAMYGRPELVGLILVLSLSTLFQSVAVVPEARLQIDLRFRTLAIFGMLQLMGTTTLSVLFAWMGFGAYSFAWPIVIVQFVRSCMLWYLAPPPVRWTLQFRRWKYLFGDSFRIFLSSILHQVVIQAAYIALGIFQSAEIVGLYYFSVNLADQTIRHLTLHLGTVLFPALARLGKESGRQVDAFLRACRLLAIIALPLCLLQAALVRPFVNVFLEPEWREAIPVMIILSIGAAFRVISAALSMLQAQGRFGTLLALNGWFALVLFSAVAVCAWLSTATVVALAAAVCWAIVSPIQGYVAVRAANGRWRDVVRVYAAPAAVGTFAVGAGVLAGTLVPTMPGDQILEAVVIVVVSGVLYLPLIRIASPRDTADLWQRVRSVLPGRSVVFPLSGSSRSQ